jgi:hypothetical protein
MAAQGWTPETLPARVIIDPTYADRDDDATGDYYAACNCHHGYLPTPPPNEWRAGTPAEWRSIRIELRAEHYQNALIWHCDSALVDDLIKASQERGALEGFDYENIENMYADPFGAEWDAAACQEYASDHGIDLPDLPGADGPFVPRALAEPSYAAALEADPDSADGQAWAEYREALEDDAPRGWLCEARQACQDHAQDNPAEIYEWWRVDPWLCARLREIGQCVIDNNYGEWWGRCTTGQGLIMDGVLQRIAAGQEPDPAEGEAGR